ncbi:probable serine/threonine-protein kinase mkcB [Uranotaenia lowii]|uniref:probable serine/threonine-protein kinase mkcB n=1 Tax=Uranotaenia lowii TaxID=190385 RepID=UPI00247A1236|nr:probable serine/threonine-protein kinase mkcB [Uranotaenia lowii]
MTISDDNIAHHNSQPSEQPTTSQHQTISAKIQHQPQHQTSPIAHQQQPTSPNEQQQPSTSSIQQQPRSSPIEQQQQSSPIQQQQPSSSNIQQPQHHVNNESASMNTSTDQSQSGTSTNLCYRTLTYIPSLSTRIIRDLKKDFKNIKIAQKTVNNIGKLYPIVKDPILPAQQSNIVYSIPCRDCEKVYIGLSTNTLTKRMYGHKSDVNKYEKILESGVTSITDIKSKLGDTTAMTDHVIKTEHRFEHARAKIIDRAQYTSTLRILEMCHITNTENTVNYRTDTAKLNTTYAGILHTVKTTSKISSNIRSKTQNPHIVNSPTAQLPPITSDSPASNLIHTFHTIDSII